MLKKWAKEIGFNTIKNLSKYQFFIENGYYIPLTTMLRRLKLLSARGQVAKIDPAKLD